MIKRILKILDIKLSMIFHVPIRFAYTQNKDEICVDFEREKEEIVIAAIIQMENNGTTSDFPTIYKERKFEIGSRRMAQKVCYVIQTVVKLSLNYSLRAKYEGKTNKRDSRAITRDERPHLQRPTGYESTSEISARTVIKQAILNFCR